MSRPMSDERLIQKYRNQLEDDAQFLDVMANTLDDWAEESKYGGWSTHQVNTNIARANECRRMAAHIRRVINEDKR